MVGATILLVVSGSAFGMVSPQLDGGLQRSDPDVEALIDMLVDFGQPTAGANPWAFAIHFMAIDEELRMGRGDLDFAWPSVHSAIRRLVQLGPKALPSLLEHLSDERQTKMIIRHEGRLGGLGGLGGLFSGSEYDPRSKNPADTPPGFARRGWGGANFKQPLDQYQVLVGDLCFNLVGQIVNRSLSAIGRMATNITFINSPVHNPALAEATRADWSGLTPEQHLAGLENEAYNFWSASSAIKRLLYYYPEDGERIALKLLSRRLVDFAAVIQYANVKLIDVDDPATWKSLLQEAIDEVGSEQVETIPIWLHSFNIDYALDAKSTGFVRSTEIIETLFPDYDPYVHRPLSVASLSDQSDLIKALRAFPNDRIDDAVRNVYLQTIAFEPRHQQEYYRDELVLECVDRLVGKGYDDEFRQYLKKRLDELEGLPEDAVARNRIPGFKRRLEALDSY